MRNAHCGLFDMRVVCERLWNHQVKQMMLEPLIRAESVSGSYVWSAIASN
jgi:hypothetical protein